MDEAGGIEVVDIKEGTWAPTEKGEFGVCHGPNLKALDIGWAEVKGVEVGGYAKAEACDGPMEVAND
jgi:hypothetical protein